MRPKKWGWGAGFGFEARSQNEENNRLQGEGTVLNLALEAWVPVNLYLSIGVPSAWVTLSPQDMLTAIHRHLWLL